MNEEKSQKSIPAESHEKERTSPNAPIITHKRFASLYIKILILVVILGALAAAYVVWGMKEDSKNESSETATNSSKQDQEKEPPLTPLQESQKAVFDGDYEGGQAILESMVSKTDNNDEKVSIYMNLATNALNLKKYDEAEQYALQSLEIKKLPGIYLLLANVMKEKNDIAQANSYAEQAKGALDKDMPGYNLKLLDIENFIKGIQ